MRIESERQLLSSGIEHTVLLSTLRLSLSVVLKKPNCFNYVSMVGKDRAAVLRQELSQAKELIKDTDVQIPRTLIYGVNGRFLYIFPTKGYIIGQEYIEEDGSVPNMQEHLQNQGLVSLVDEYIHEPRNFISRGGIVYWIDPTRGTMGRILESMDIMSLITYRRVRRRMSKVIRFLGL